MKFILILLLIVGIVGCQKDSKEKKPQEGISSVRYDWLYEYPFREIYSYEDINNNDRELVLSYLNRIGREIIKLSFDDIRNRYVIGGNSSIEDAEIVLIGEIHNSPEARVDNAAIINTFYKKSNLLLEESRHLAPKEKEDNGGTLLNGICQSVLTGKKGGLPGRCDDWRMPVDMSQFENLSGIKTNGWDTYDVIAVALFGNNCPCFDKKGIPPIKWLTMETPEELRHRNIHMAITIEDKLKEYSKIFVVAGAAHVPLGEYVDYKDCYSRLHGEEPNISIHDYFNNFEKVISNLGTKDGVKLFCYSNILHNTTKELFNFLETKKYAMITPRPRVHHLVIPKA